MKKLLLTTIILLTFTACANKEVVQSTAATTAAPETTAEQITETKKSPEINNEIINSANKITEINTFDPSIPFTYNGYEDYMKEITDDMLATTKDNYDTNGVVMIPTPYIVEVDESDMSDIKVFGDFWIFGYDMSTSIFHMKNGGSYPGCYHLKNEDGAITVTSREIAEDGSRFMPSLIKICNNDEALAKEVSNVASGSDHDDIRIIYAMMYANANNLKFAGIKDYGWPVLLLDNASDAEYLYSFYSSYFDEVKDENLLNDFEDRINNLREKYIDSNLLQKLENTDSDPVIKAQDVTDEMIDTLQVDDLGSGDLIVSFNGGNSTPTTIKIKLDYVDGKRLITNIE